MEQLTLEEIAKALTFIVLLGGAVASIIKGIKKVLVKAVNEQTEKITARLEKQEKALAKIDSENCKNFLVQCLSAVEKGETLTTEEKMRLAEEFEHYTAIGENSYIKDWHSRLKQAGKI